MDVLIIGRLKNRQVLSMPQRMLLDQKQLLNLIKVLKVLLQRSLL